MENYQVILQEHRMRDLFGQDFFRITQPYILCLNLYRTWGLRGYKDFNRKGRNTFVNSNDTSEIDNQIERIDKYNP